jgi:DNA-binding PadR family transcriptional regulator
MLKLTRRQEVFIQKMLELKREFECPVRYSLLAERLGVSPFTAYDMLCLLEEKGYVVSEYHLPSDKSGPGRAERLFYPTQKSQEHIQRLIAETSEAGLEGEALKRFLLDRLRRGETPDNELTGQMMARLLPDGQANIRFCVEVMTVAALRLQGSQGGQALYDHLPELLPGQSSACRANLCLLGGFVFGLLAQQNAPGQEWLGKLREHLQGYLEAVMGMNDQECGELAARLDSVFASSRLNGRGK